MSTHGEGLLLARQDGIVRITLNHPERANALDPAEFHALAKLFGTVASDAAVKAVVLTGQGDRAFCAGLNLRNGQAIQQDLASDGPTGLGAALRAAADIKVPIIGRINGACVAGGMGLLGACDHVIACNLARFGLPEISHGIYPFVAIAGLGDRGAASVVRRLADTGTMIDADAALDAGLVDELCSPTDLDSRVSALVDRISAKQTLPRHLARLSNDAGLKRGQLEAAENRVRTTKIQIVNS